jgi:hypothetical protein
VTIDISCSNQKEIQCAIYDSYGTAVLTGNLGMVKDVLTHQISISGLSKGLYLLRLFNENLSVTKSFIKN